MKTWKKKVFLSIKPFFEINEGIRLLLLVFCLRSVVVFFSQKVYNCNNLLKGEAQWNWNMKFQTPNHWLLNSRLCHVTISLKLSNSSVEIPWNYLSEIFCFIKTSDIRNDKLGNQVTTSSRLSNSSFYNALVKFTACTSLKWFVLCIMTFSKLFCQNPVNSFVL